MHNQGVSDPDLITAAQATTGTTQAQLAAAIGYHLRALTYWLAGRPAPVPARKLLQLLAAGKITTEDL